MTEARQASRSSSRRSVPSISTGAAHRVVQPAQQLGQRGLAGPVLADDGQRGAGGDREVEARRARAGRRGSRTRRRGSGSRARRRAAAGRHRAGPVGQRAGRRPSPIPAGPRRRPARAAPSRAQLSPPKAMALTPMAACRATIAADRSRPPSAARSASVQNASRLAATTMTTQPATRPLAQPGRLVLQVVEVAALAGEPVDDPVGQPEQADLLGRRRVDGQAVRVLGVPLGPLHLGRAAVLPDGALAQQPVGGRPGQHEHDGLPPAVPGQQDGRGDAGDQPDEAVGDEVHAVRQRWPGDAEIEVAGHREVVGQVGPLEVGDARRTERGGHQAVVQRRGRAVAERGADRLVQRADDLGGDEHDGHRDERCGERLAAGHGADQPAGDDGDAPPGATPGRPGRPTTPRRGPARPGAGRRRRPTPGAGATARSSGLQREHGAPRLLAAGRLGVDRHRPDDHVAGSTRNTNRPGSTRRLPSRWTTGRLVAWRSRWQSPVAMARWKPAQCASRCSGGTMRSSDRPTASSARWPNSRSAPALHDVMTPSVSAITMPVRAVVVIPMAPSSTRGARPILYEWDGRIVELIVSDTSTSDARPARRHRHRRQPRHRRGHRRRAGRPPASTS